MVQITSRDDNVLQLQHFTALFQVNPWASVKYVTEITQPLLVSV